MRYAVRSGSGLGRQLTVTTRLDDTDAVTVRGAIGGTATPKWRAGSDSLAGASRSVPSPSACPVTVYRPLYGRFGCHENVMDELPLPHEKPGSPQCPVTVSVWPWPSSAVSVSDAIGCDIDSLPVTVGAVDTVLPSAGAVKLPLAAAGATVTISTATDPSPAVASARRTRITPGPPRRGRTGPSR